MQFFARFDAKKWSYFQTGFGILMALAMFTVPLTDVKCNQLGMEISGWPWPTQKLYYIDIKEIVRMILPIPFIIIIYTKSLRDTTIYLLPLRHVNYFIEEVTNGNPGIRVINQF
jgi:hypothetical protein